MSKWAVPNQPKTPVKGFRIPTDLYDAALAKAQSEGRTLTEVVREALQRYIDGD
jgi:predicted DNA-binding protein